MPACSGGEPGATLAVGGTISSTTHALGNSHAVILGTTLKTGSICFPKEMLLELAQGAEVVVERIEAMVGEKVVIG